VSKKMLFFLFLALSSCIVLSACSHSNIKKLEVAVSLPNCETNKPLSDSQFHDGFMLVFLSGKPTFIDQNGKTPIHLPSNIRPIRDFSNKRALVSDKKTNHFGYIDTNGNVIIPCKYDRGGLFSDNIALVESSGIKTLINTSGKTLATVSSQYDSEGTFCDGLSTTSDLKTGKQGFIDESGNIAIPCNYSFLRGFSEKLSVVGNEHELCGYIATDGTIAIPFKYKSAGDFSNGLAPVENEHGQNGYIDKAGVTKIPFVFKSVASFSEGLAAVQNEKGQYSFIDTTGKKIIDCSQFTRVFNFRNGLCLVGIENSAGGNFGYIDRSGKLLTPLTYRVDSGSFDGNCLLAVKDDSNACILKMK